MLMIFPLVLENYKVLVIEVKFQKLEDENFRPSELKCPKREATVLLFSLELCVLT
jgi:hypothetical protein